VASLRLRKYRRQQHAFLVEGADLVAAGLAAGRRPQVVLTIVDGEDELGGGTPEAFEGHGGLTVQPVTRKVAERMSTLESPPGVMAVFPEPESAPLAESQGDDALILYVDRVADPGNLGTLLRAAAAFGVGALVTSPESVDPLAPKVVRGSMGAIFAVPTYPGLRLTDVLTSVRGCRVYGLAAHGGKDLRTAELTRPAVLCVGAERAGLSAAVASHADQLLTIPLAAGGAGAVESLNAGVAGAIALYELSRRALGTPGGSGASGARGAPRASGGPEETAAPGAATGGETEGAS